MSMIIFSDKILKIAQLEAQRYLLSALLKFFLKFSSEKILALANAKTMVIKLTTEKFLPPKTLACYTALLNPN